MSIDVGAKAPNFKLPTDGGGELELSSLKGGKVVLYFYPKDSTRDARRKPKGFATISRRSRRPERPSSASPKTALNAMTISKPNTTCPSRLSPIPRAKRAKRSVCGSRK